MILTALAAAAIPTLLMAADEARLMRFPATNGSEIVFSYAGDLYKVPATGGEAQRLTSWNVYDCMAVGSGFAYYSLSSLLIVQLKEASAGIEIASQLGAIALLANIIREMLALFGAPLYASFFGKFAPVSVAGINSMDVCLPVISRYSGKNIVPVAIIHGIILEISVPLLISLFCK